MEGDGSLDASGGDDGEVRMNNAAIDDCLSA